MTARTRLRAGEAAELAFVWELERLGYAAWRTGGDAQVKTLPDGRRIPIAAGNDPFGFDVIGLRPDGLILAQVKGGRAYRGPSKAWRERFDRLPRPPWLTCLWCYWSGWGEWRVERLLIGGERDRLPWPPVDGRAA